LATVVLLGGCQYPTTKQAQQLLWEIEASDLPRELDMATIPAYRVAPPDILILEAVNNIRPAKDPLRAGDELIIRASNTFPVDPSGDAATNEFKIIRNVYRVQTDGTVDLGPEYGNVAVEGMTVDEAKTAIEAHLKDTIGLATPKVAVSMPDVNGRQEISGEHLVRPDGTVSLGIYGSVYVAGMTVDEIKQAVEAHLSEFIHQPEIQVDVAAYNSKVIYVITDGGGFGETVTPIPFTGNDTVLDAVAKIQGLSEVSSKMMWVARPAPNGTGCAQKLPVDWRAITEDGVTTTNYQLLPGDRIYIRADKLVALDSAIAKIIAPVQRVFGAILLGTATVQRLENPNLANTGAGFF
jgi:polysaccharide export outer membrane protein